jgi:hypothetical protein
LRQYKIWRRASSAISNINANVNIPGNNVQEMVQMIGQTANGQLEAMYFDSGFGGDSATTGDLLATNLMSPSLAGYNVVNAGLVAHTDLFPIS